MAHLDLLTLPTSMLAPPFMVDWALQRLKAQRLRDPALAIALEGAWFSELPLRRLLASGDNQALPAAFHAVTPERFACIAQTLAERFSAWGDTVACWAAPILATQLPERAEKLFSTFINQGEFGDLNKTFGVIKSIGSLPRGMGMPLAITAVDKLRSVEVETLGRIYAHEALALAVKFELPIAEEVLLSILDGESEKLDNDAVARVAGSLLGETPWYRQAGSLRRKETNQTFASMRILFEAPAPLSELDRLTTSSSIGALSDAMVLLSAHKASRYRLELLHGALTRFQRRAIGHADRLVDLVVGVIATEFARTAPDWQAVTLDEALDLVALDIPSLPDLEGLTRRIAVAPRTDAVQGIRRRLEHVQLHYGGVHLVELIGRLRYDEFVSELIECLDSGGDFLNEAAGTALGCLGDVVEKILIDRWGDLSFSQRLYCIHALEMIAGPATPDFLVRAWPDMRQDLLEPWCNLAVAVPDERLLSILEHEVRREDSGIDQAYCTLCVLLEKETPQRPAAQERIGKKRERFMRMAGAMLSPPAPEEATESVIPMELRCTACGDRNQYEVRHLFVTPEVTTGKPFVADELACRSCGQEAELEMTNLGSLSLTAELMKRVATGRHVSEEGPLHLVSMSLADGRIVGPSEAIEHYRKNIETNPTSIVDLLSLGNCYRNVYRPKEALKYFRKCSELDPTCAEAALSWADLVAEETPAAALQILARALEHRPRWRFHRLRAASRAEFGQAFAELYNNLRLTAGDPRATALHPSFLSERVGRNEPCPCGSDKKYKRCCGVTG